MFPPIGQGVPNIGGWDTQAGGWDTPAQMAWSQVQDVQPYLTDAQLLRRALECRPVGTRMWARIVSVLPTLPLAPPAPETFVPLVALYAWDSGGAAWDQPSTSAWDWEGGEIMPVAGLDTGYLCFDGFGYGGYIDGTLIEQSNGDLLMTTASNGAALWGE
jgi:hypothetical protein